MSCPGLERKEVWMLQSSVKRVGAVLCCAAGVLLVATTVRADGPRAGSFKDGPGPQQLWQGFYVGANAGMSTGDTQGRTAIVNTDFSLAGGLYGVQAGYNWQRGNTVFGIEGTWSQSTIQGDTNCVAVLTCSRDVNWVATAVGRLGTTYGHTLIYALGGVAW